jgi:mRNA deadenylase 3'-5' endonuclease subunit Ccr4
MSFRVMTYNVLDGGVNRESHILEVIETAKPDVVILQEVYTEKLLKFLSESLGMN